jgi:hypothetical protein
VGEIESSAFEAAASRLRAEPDVESGTGFGSNPGLRSRGKVFAILIEDQLVVKLPAERCSALVDAGEASAFEIGTRRMREWARVPLGDAVDWSALMAEARAYVLG